MINQKYKIKKLLGKGRSAVYLCEDVDLPGKDIAIKILPKEVDPFEIKFFRDEFFTLHKLHHPNIINSFDFGTVLETGSDKDISAGSKFFTLEYFAGKSLLDYGKLKNENSLKEIIKQVCSVLYYLHLSNYIYYDLKPENILAAEVNGMPVIKMIDLGFAQYTVGNIENIVRGTAEYIAPEILKNSKHDYRVDFYSLGIVLYKIIYNRFPFDTTDELEIYKAHIEKEFDFPETKFSSGLIDVVKKLLKKEPNERYGNAIQILADLEIPIDENIYKDWLPARVFADRKDSVTILNTYIGDSTSGEVFTVRGSEGAGKTSLAYEIYASHDNCIFVENNISLTGTDFVKSFVKKIVFNEFIYPNLPDKTKEKIKKLLSGKTEDIVSYLKSIFSEITGSSKFILILDAFNSYNNYAIELFKNLIPIFQVNKIKVILTENTDRPFITDFIHNLREVNLTPFTEIHLTEFIEKSYSALFPKDELKKLILSYADLLPGNLESFIKDIILLKILSFTPEGIKIASDEKAIKTLKSSHEEIYALRVKNLTSKEKEAAQFISAFEVSLKPEIISSFLKLSPEETNSILSRLEQKNIIHAMQINANPVFVSEGLKRFVYSANKDRKKLHGQAAKYLRGNFPDFSKAELARQFELNENYKASFEVAGEELEEAETISAYSYQKNILRHLTEFPLDKKDLFRIKKDLTETYFKLGENGDALNLARKLLEEKINPEEKRELQVLEGRSLIGLTEYEEGKKIIEKLLPQIIDENTKKKLLLEIATVELNLNQYNEAEETCRKIINSAATAPEETGQTYEMLGLISLYRDNDPDASLEFFNKGNKAYTAGGLRFRIAQMQMNIGNIYGMKGENDKAYSYWNNSLEINQSIGSLDQQAKLYVNLGIYYLDNLNYEKSIESYQMALSIFTSLGNKKGIGLTQTNLGEIYTITCDYQNAIESLTSAAAIFEKLQNLEEELEALVMLAKLYFSIKDIDSLTSILKVFEVKAKSAELSDRYKNYFEFIDVLEKFLSGESEILINKLNNLMEFFLQQESRYDYFTCSILKAKSYLRIGKYKNAFEELCSKDLLNLCMNNFFFEAERNYLIGEIIECDPSLDSKPFIDYYHIAYDMISESYITELTWKVLYALARTYGDRGNFGKASEFIKYSKSLINFTAENIKDSRIRNIFLNDPERKEALGKLNLLYSKSM